MPDERGSPEVFNFNSAQTAKLSAALSKANLDARLTVLRKALQDRTPELVAQIFPRAHTGGAEARIGNLEGDAGESLAIELRGDKAGLWHDHATGEGGDLIALWQQTSRASFLQAVDDLEHWAGLTHARKPAWTSSVVKLGAQRQAVAATEPKPDQALGAPTKTWHYFSADGVILGKVSRYILADGSKTYRPFNAAGEMKAPDPRPLYRLPNIRVANTVIFVEGEKCADALESAGYEATAAMGGANAIIEKTDWTPLAGKTVMLWPDNDEPGLAFMRAVAPVLETIGCAVQFVTPPKDKPHKWDAADAIEAGEEITDYLPKAAPPIPALRFRILTVEELFDIKAPTWRIDGIFPEHGSSTLYGAFESFKSFVAIDMALALATGSEWQGHPLNPTPVLYIAGEGQHGLAHRVYGWLALKGFDHTQTAFRALPEAVAIPQIGDTDGLLRSIESTGIEFGLIVFDTLTRMSGGASLNDEKDMQAYVRGSDRVRLATGAHVMHIGHSGKDQAKGLMGSVVLPGAMETIICVERRADSLTLINTSPKGKQKDGPNFDDIRLQARTVHFERNGVDTTTRILVLDDEVVIENNEPKKPGGPLQMRILQAVRDGVSSGGIGFTRLSFVLGSNEGTLSRTIKKMEESGLIVCVGTDGSRRWVMP